MPPKVRIPREAIIEKAFELTKAYGFEKVTARLLASELKGSTQPCFPQYGRTKGRSVQKNAETL